MMNRGESRRTGGDDMGGPSQVETVFSAALERKTAEERIAYLDQACAGDAPLRRRVDRLLAAHPLAVDFLARPAVERALTEAFDAESQAQIGRASCRGSVRSSVD